MNRGIFIIGTDTGVGKTVISAGLAAAIRRQGLRVGVMKPVATGCRLESGEWLSDDALALAEAAGLGRESLDQINPVRFENPMAPLPASRLENRSVDLDKIRQAYHEIQSQSDFMIVEGIGGLLVPITENLFVRDLVAAFGLPVVLVSRTKLGTINHTMLTIEALRSENIPILGIIFNRPADEPVGKDEEFSPLIVGELSDVPVLGIVPYLKDTNQKSFEEFCDSLVKQL